MAALTLRIPKGSPLTNAELDANFSALNTDLTGKVNATFAAMVAALGYTPSNKAGDTFAGNVFVNAGVDSRFLLQVSGVTQAQLQATATAVRLASNNALPLLLSTNGVDRATLDSVGNITFGSASASGVFKVQGANAGDLVVFESTDASGTGAPDFVLFRNSASPAAGDQIANILFRGKDSGGADQSYARIISTIIDSTAGAESGDLRFGVQTPTGFFDLMTLAAAGMSVTGTLASSGAITQNGSQVLHAGNYSAYALPLSGGTLSGALTAGGSVTIGTGGTYAAGSIYSDASWGMLFRAKQASPVSAQFRWSDSADTELARIGNGGAFNTLGAITQNGNQVLHAGNYSSFALPLTGGTITGSVLTTTAATAWGVYSNTNGLNHSGIWFSSNIGELLLRKADGSLSTRIAADGSYAFINGNNILHAGNYTSYSPSLTGSGASGTWGINVTGNAATVSSISGNTGLMLNRLTPTSNIDGLTTTNFRSTLFNTTAGGSAIATARWNSVPSVLGSLGLYGTMLAWGASDTHGFLALSYSGAAAKIGGGSADSITWSADLLHSSNYNSYSPTLTGGNAIGTWDINVTGSAGSAQLATHVSILDTRAGQYTPNDYADYRATYEFTDQIVGATWHTAMTLQGWGNGYAAWQIIGGATTGTHENWYLRSGINTTWNPLRTILHSGNYSSYALPLSGGTLTGVTTYTGDNYARFGPNSSWGASLRVGGNGRVSTTDSTVATTNGNLHIDSADGSSLYLNYYAGGGIIGPGGATVLHSGNYSSYALPLSGGTLSGSLTVNSNIYTSSWFYNTQAAIGLYNSATANHWYSENNSSWTVGSPNTSYGEIRLRQNYQGTLKGSFYWDSSGIGLLNEQSGWGVRLNYGTGYGGTLYGSWAVTGSVTATGNVTAYSDERLKTDWASLPADFIERLATIKSGTYTRIDSGLRQAGASAQDMQALLAEVVEFGADEAKTLSLAYGNAALVSAIELAKRVVDQEARIEAQEARIAQLESLINKLIGE